MPVDYTTIVHPSLVNCTMKGQAVESSHKIKGKEAKNWELAYQGKTLFFTNTPPQIPKTSFET